MTFGIFPASDIFAPGLRIVAWQGTVVILGK